MDNITQFSFKRVETVQKKLKDYSGYLICDPVNLFYLTGFSDADVLFVICKNQLFFFLPEMLINQFKNRFPAARCIRLNKLPKDLDVLKKERIKKVIIDTKRISYDFGQKISKNKYFLYEFIKEDTILDKMRMIKDKYEINCISKACEIAAKTFKWVRGIVKMGMTEEYLARLIKQKMLSLGADGVSFEPIVAFGSNTSYPHYVSSNTKIGKQGPLLLDFGCSFKGYNSDLTRTIYLGRISKLYDKIYQIVSLAQEKAISLIRPGKALLKVDKTARDIIGSKGYKKYFTHSLGHGIGLEVHEFPRVSKKSSDKAASGMVLTVEPGIYVPGFGGVRIEDVVLVTNSGCDVLTEL
ncbi:MAG: aminopeptidase P family protein [bacterium]